MDDPIRHLNLQAVLVSLRYRFRLFANEFLSVVRQKKISDVF
jgi:hypothetical protein